MSENLIVAEIRTEFGKGAARRIRRDDKVPAVLYGHGVDPIHISLPGHDTMLALKHGGANALLTIDVDGKTQLAIPQQVQAHPIKGFLEHLDLLIVMKGEKVNVEIPVHIVGQAASETLVNAEHNTVSIQAEATHIPEYVEVDVEGLEAGTQILAKDLTMPEGAVLHMDEEALIVNISVAPKAEVLEPAEGEEVAAADVPVVGEAEAEAEASSEE
jgi:large subunit ribosomal protein L25